MAVTQQQLFAQGAERQGLSAGELALAAKIFGQESSGGKANTDKPNYAQARGGMQVTKDTFNGLQRQGLIPKDYQWSNQAHSIEAGLAYIKQLSKTYNGDPRKIAAAYYGGPKAIRKDGTIANFGDKKNPKAPTVHQYVEQVLGRNGGLTSSQLKGQTPSLLRSTPIQGNISSGVQPSAQASFTAQAPQVAPLIDVNAIAPVRNQYSSIAGKDIGAATVPPEASPTYADRLLAQVMTPPRLGDNLPKKIPYLNEIEKMLKGS